MTRVLLVKTSSLGDVVHNLPVVADIRSAFAGVEIDWVVERTFSAIPAMHPGVRRIVCCDIRRWRHSWHSASTRREWRVFVEELRACSYDAIIDTQGLFKSAVLTRLAKGPRYGLDWRSSREPLRLFYDRVYSVPRELHAVVRNRRLCGLALGYQPGPVLDYGLHVTGGAAAAPAERYVVFLHATSHPSKLWPEERWIALGRAYAEIECGVVLPWGNDVEHERAQRLAASVPGAVVPERMDLAAIARMLARAAAVIGVDTGLTHLAAALDRPVVGIYGVTSPGTTGVYAHGRAMSVGFAGGFPTVAEVIGALAKLGAAPEQIAASGTP